MPGRFVELVLAELHATFAALVETALAATLRNQLSRAQQLVCGRGANEWCLNRLCGLKPDLERNPPHHKGKGASMLEVEVRIKADESDQGIQGTHASAVIIEEAGGAIANIVPACFLERVEICLQKQRIFLFVVLIAGVREGRGRWFGCFGTNWRPWCISGIKGGGELRNERRRVGDGGQYSMIQFAVPDLPTLVAATAATAAAVWTMHSLLPSVQRERARIPTVTAWIPFVGNAIAFGRDPVGFMRECRARHGAFFRTLIAGKQLAFFVDHSHFHALLKAPQLSFESFERDVSTRVFGLSPEFMASVPADYQAVVHRQHVQFLLNGPGGLDGLVASSVQSQSRLIEALPLNTTLPLFSTLARISFESTTNSLYGNAVFSSDLFEALADFDASFGFLVSGAPPFLVRKALTARDTISAHMRAFLYNEDGTQGASAWIRARNALFREYTAATGIPFVGDVGILWASATNSIPAHFWVLYYLLRDREAWEAVCREVAERLQGDPSSWTRARLAECVLLESAVEETLRLATNSMLMREVVEDCVITLDADTVVHFRKGDKAAMFLPLTHYDENLFEDPTRFKVDRFVQATNAQRNALMVFGAGKTMCPGRLFAKAQLKTFVALLTRRAPGLRLVDPDVVVGFDSSRLGLGVYSPDSNTAQFVLVA
ncbi:cytochrome P450 [Chytriomyces sp. MP71]|nr:cytochrome P450 [Chytriomyces sp. MP71]